MYLAEYFKRFIVVAAPLASLANGAAIEILQDVSACPGYKASNARTEDGWPISADLNLAGSPCNTYGTDLSKLQLQVEYQTPQRLHVKIYDAAKQVYQIPESVLPSPRSQNISPENSDLKFSMTSSPFSFAVSRKSTNETLFNTSGSSLIFQSQYLGLRTMLPEEPNLFGLGESTDSFRLLNQNYTRTLWSRDAPGTPERTNLYGNHPVYFDHRASGTHAVFLRNSNGMDININKDMNGQYLEYNTLGGVIDLYFLAGPTPKDVSTQYAETVGMPTMHKYSGFGLNNCRYGYQDIFEVAEVVQNYSKAGIPLETQWTDIDYMDLRRVFSLDPLRFNRTLVRELVSYLHSRQQGYVMMVDPAVAYHDYTAFNEGAAGGAFLKTSNGSVYQGVVWPGVAAFPDWFSNSTQEYWTQQFASFFNPETGIDIDQLWIDMNEASNFCTWPCTDPTAFSRQNNDPPNPPAVRLSSPRPIEGLSSDFQPKCRAEITFNVHADTVSGESIVLYGSGPTIGSGEILNAPLMAYPDYPTWTLTVDMPANSNLTYQYVRKSKNGDFTYEAANRFIQTGACNSTGHVVEDTISTKKSATSGQNARRSLPSPHVPYSGPKKRQSTSMAGLPGRDLISPRYHINNTAGSLSNLTIRTDIQHENGLTLYDTHNYYGHMMGAASREAMLHRRPTERPLIITRSTFAGSGSKIGHWLGDNEATWDSYRYNIKQIQEFAALYQMPMVGADVCGFIGNTTEDLCARWIFVGAFAPFFRDHSNLGDQPHEFYRWPKTIAAARSALDIRMRLIDYAYSAMYRQTKTGLPMITPMFFEYPSDPETALLQYQFFYGDSLMVAPIHEDNSSSVNLYMPKDQFYDFFTYRPIQGQGTNTTINNVDFTTVPLYFRGGGIVPMRTESANTTTMLRQKNFNVVIAPSANGTYAAGSLYLDDGKSIDPPTSSEISFIYANGSFTMSGKMDYDPGNVVLQNVILLGQKKASMKGVYNSTSQSTTYEINATLRKPYSMQLS